MPKEVLQYERITDDTELGKLLLSTYTSSFRHGYVKCKDVILPEYYTTFAEPIRNLDIKDDDVWVCSFMKTGTTWTQEMVWCIGHDMDLETARNVYLAERFPFLELSTLFDLRNLDLESPSYLKDSVQHMSTLKSPRYMKGHLPFKLLPKKLLDGSTNAKIIYVTRNPKDVCISFYHYSQLLDGYHGDFDEFCKLFINDMVPFGPYWDHVYDFWEASKTNKNILFITYEEMKKDLGAVIAKVCLHLNKSLSTNQMNLLKEHLSFENMKNNQSVNFEFKVDFNKKHKLVDEKYLDKKFMRKGQVGDWKNVMTPELSQLFDKRTNEKLNELNAKFQV